MPSLSIITPSRNHLQGLTLCCESLPRQTLRDWEHVIIDSVSTDGSVDYAAKLESTRILSEPDKSLEEALRKGLRLSEGKYVTFLLCWDRLVSVDWLEKGVRFLEENPSYSMVTASLFDSKGKANNYHVYPSGAKFNYYFFIAPWTTLNETAMICRRSVILELFPDYGTARADSDIFNQFWINFVTDGHQVRVFPEDVVESFDHGTSRVAAELKSGEFRRKEHDFLDKKRVIRREILRRERVIRFKDAEGREIPPAFSWARFVLATLLYKLSVFFVKKVLRRKIPKFQYVYAQELARKCLDWVM